MNRHLETIIGHLGAAIVQRTASDDKIIMDHVQEAYDAAVKLRIVLDKLPHMHAAGTAISRPLDECAICGHDLRDPIHASQ